MPEITVTIHHAGGLHARTAACFVETAGRFACTVHVRHGDRVADARSLLSLLTLGITQGSAITLCAEGPDADAALAALRRLVDLDSEGAA